MRIYSLSIIIVFAYPLAPACANSNSFIADPIFIEDFTHEIDPSVWKIDQMWNYTPQSIHTDQDGLHITATQEKIDTGSNIPPKNTSGSVETHKTFLYGRFEFWAKLPKGRGFWPALWLDEKPWKEGSQEIDIIEGWGSHTNAVQSTLHLINNGKHIGYICAQIGIHKGACKDNSSLLKGKIPDLNTDYHAFKLEWLPDHLTWFLDGQPYFTITKDIPNVPMYIIINLALGGSFDGPITNDTPFPASFDVKMVKVWAIKQ